MVRSVYVASVEGYTGKSAVALGVLDALSRRVERVGVYRPIVRRDSASYRSGRDYVLETLTEHVYGDCAVNPDPTAEQLADIAISSAATAAAFGIGPRVAMLSYSTGSSGSGTEVEKVSKATALVKERAPHLAVEGPIQYDAAIDSAVARTKLPDSAVAVAVGPVLQGLRKPVNDLSRGATVRDIVNTIAITAIQAQQRGPR